MNSSLLVSGQNSKKPYTNSENFPEKYRHMLKAFVYSCVPKVVNV